MTRDVDSFVLEVEYWQALLEPLSMLEGLIAEAARPLADNAVALIPLAMLCRTDLDRQALEVLSEGMTASLATLRAMQEQTSAVGRLIDGRLLVLAQESPAGRGADE